MPLPPSVTLTGSWKISHDGRTDSGPLVADDKGLAVDVSSRQGLMKKITRRYYVTTWDDVTAIDITQPENKQFAGSTINAHSVLLTVDTPERQMAFTLKLTDIARVRNLLGAHIAKVNNRKA